MASTHKITVSPETDVACNHIAQALNIPRRCKNKIPYSHLLSLLPQYFEQHQAQQQELRQLREEITTLQEAITARQGEITTLQEEISTLRIQVANGEETIHKQACELKKKWSKLKDIRQQFVPLKTDRWDQLTREGKRNHKKRLIKILRNLLPFLRRVMADFTLEGVGEELVELILTSKNGKTLKRQIKGKILYKIQKHVTPEAIVVLKDAVRLSDLAYGLLRRLLPQVLPSTYQMKLERTRISSLIWCYLPDSTYTGVEIDPKIFLAHALPRYHNITEGMTIQLFGSIDALQLTTTFTRSVTLMGWKLGKMNNPANCFATAIWEGKETRYLIEKNAPRYIKFMQWLVANKGRFTVAGVQVTIELYFIADMAALWAVLGHDDCIYCDIKLNDYTLNVGGQGELKNLDEVWT